MGESNLISIIAIPIFLIFGIGSAVFAYLGYSKGADTQHASYTIEIVAENSGSDMLGNPVGYGLSEDVQIFDVKEGDIFYEGYSDKLYQNPRKYEKDECIGEIFRIKKLGSESCIIDNYGSEQTVEYGKKIFIHSIMFVSDGANTIYHITINKN